MDCDASIIVEMVEDEEHIDLPPGFRFHPTDEELISHYLKQKVFNTLFSATAIGEVDLNKIEPWDLPSKFLNLSIFSFFFYNKRILNMNITSSFLVKYEYNFSGPLILNKNLHKQYKFYFCSICFKTIIFVL